MTNTEISVFLLDLGTRTEEHHTISVDTRQLAGQAFEQLLEINRARLAQPGCDVPAGGQEKLYAATFEPSLKIDLVRLTPSNLGLCLLDQGGDPRSPGGRSGRRILVVFSGVGSVSLLDLVEQQPEEPKSMRRMRRDRESHSSDSDSRRRRSSEVGDVIVRDHDLQVIRRFTAAALKFHKLGDQEGDFSEHLWSSASFAEAIRKADAAREALKLKVTDRVTAYNTLAVVAALMSGFGLAILIEVQFVEENLQGALAGSVSFLFAAVASMNLYGLVVLASQIYFAQRLAASDPAAAEDFLGRGMGMRHIAMSMVFWSLPLFALATAFMCLYMAADSDLATTWYFAIPPMLCLTAVSLVAGCSIRKHNVLYQVTATAHGGVVRAFM